MLDDEMAALAHALETERNAGRKSRRRRRRTPTLKKRTRAWWASTAMPAGGGGAAMQTATRPAPSPGSPKEAPAMTLAEFLDGL
jgi:hypothetical protein